MGGFGAPMGQMNPMMGQMNPMMGQMNPMMGQMNPMMGQMGQMGQMNPMMGGYAMQSQMRAPMPAASAADPLADLMGTGRPMAAAARPRPAVAQARDDFADFQSAGSSVGFLPHHTCVRFLSVLTQFIIFSNPPSRKTRAGTTRWLILAVSSRPPRPSRPRRTTTLVSVRLVRLPLR
jgi:hypothetical protein